MILVPAALVLLGIVLLAVGFRRQRIGDEPRCRRCSYLLVHLTSDRCPECGLEISEANTIRGMRQRGRSLILMGLTSTLLAVAWCTPAAVRALAQVPWYQYKPAYFVLRDLDSPATYLKAMDELTRRDKAGELSATMLQRFLDRALQEQDLPSPRPQFALFLADMAAAGRLPQPQQDRFFGKLFTLQITARPEIRLGDPLFICLQTDYLGPPGGPQCKVESGEWSLDGQQFEFRIGGITGPAPFDHQLLNTMPLRQVTTPGEHELTGTIRYDVVDGPVNRPRNLGRVTKTVRCRFTVVRKDVPRIELLDPKPLQAAVRACITIHDVKWSPGRIEASYHITQPPCDVAFDLFLRDGDGYEYPMLSAHCGKGETKRGSVMAMIDLQTQLSGKCRVILRPSVAEAKRTAHLNAIYNGELIFRALEITTRP